MSEKIYALDLNNEEWIKWLAEELRQPKFRADQICQWMWQKKVFDAEEMTNLSLPLRELLTQRVEFSAPELVNEQHSKLDGTRKYLWKLRDGNTVESVLLRQNDRLTACISTQVGCPLQCTFCATGLSGFVRNLSAGEIAGQFLAMEKNLDREINNIVYMGMGEPFLNTENVLKSVRMLNDPKMRNLGIRHMTISTSGVIPGINELAESGLGVRLAVSLHAADNDLRSRLMPVNQTYPLAELRDAMQTYQKKTGDRITIEYALFGGVNDGVEQARGLVRFLKGIHVYVNLIPFNAVDDRYERPKAEDILRFRSILTTAGFENEIRQEQGSDIDAACGQLRRKTMEGSPCDLEPKPHTVTRKDSVRAEAPKEAPTRRKRSAATGELKEVTKRPSGGFVEKRGEKRKKTDLPEKDRYRSGKMKEARPTYRGQGDDEKPHTPYGYKKESAAEGREGKPRYRKDDKPRYAKSDKPRYSKDDKPTYERKEKSSTPRDGKPRYGKNDKPRYERGEKSSFSREGAPKRGRSEGRGSSDKPKSARPAGRGASSAPRKPAAKRPTAKAKKAPKDK
ncbi:MAG: 23S rRNA (adenine(2503)-C(2))-methyltransferase RlmN [Synergistaceae bacterium]|nr:23S rRNA (adenine(2503)-C(2))-methyltransferase RlmN [Synergistaceae bacterium]